MTATEAFNHSIKHATFLSVPREKVFDTITSARGWDSFFTQFMELDPKPGGAMLWQWLKWGPDSIDLTVPGKVREIERPSRFVFEWGREHPTVITIILEEHPLGTILRLTESGYRKTDSDLDTMLDCASGWGEALTLLKFYLEYGILYDMPSRLVPKDEVPR